MTILRSSLLSKFACLGDACEDTCCKGWGMQVDAATYARYKKEAPELLDAVASGEAERVMRRDPQTDYCVKLEQGWCGVQRKYGPDFLSDACHFYPRVTRVLGDKKVMTAALSCPEIVRLALFQDSDFSYENVSLDRLPAGLKDYAPAGMSAAQTMEIHRAFLAAALDKSAGPERILARLSSVARSLALLPVASWPEAVPFYLAHADSRLPEAKTRPEDPFHLLHALAGLVGAARKSDRPRLAQTMQEMQYALGVTLNPDTNGIALTQDSVERHRALQAKYNKEWKTMLAPVLKRYIAAQLSLALFPFAGLGDTPAERITVIGVRFATLKLALMCALEEDSVTLSVGEGSSGILHCAQNDALIVRVVQSLSRFLDHLADYTLSRQIYDETGWSQEARLRGIVGDC